MKKNDNYFWYVPETNTYLSKEESKPIIERKIKLYEMLINKTLNTYFDYIILLNESNKYKDNDSVNYLFSIDEAVSFICTEFEEIIKEFYKYDD